MVRFEQKLASNIVEEWSVHYLDYRRLKKLLYSPSIPNSPLRSSPSRGSTVGSLGSPILSIFRRRSNSAASTPLLAPLPNEGSVKSLSARPIPTQRLMESPSNNTEGKSDQFDGAVTFNVAQNDPVGKYLFEIDSSDVMMESSNSSVFRQVLFDEIQKIESFYLETLKKVEETFIYLNKQTEQRQRSESFDYNAVLDIDVDEGVSSNLHANESLRRAFADSSKVADYLQNFCVLNFTAIGTCTSPCSGQTLASFLTLSILFSTSKNIEKTR